MVDEGENVRQELFTGDVRLSVGDHRGQTHKVGIQIRPRLHHVLHLYLYTARNTGEHIYLYTAHNTGEHLYLYTARNTGEHIYLYTARNTGEHLYLRDLHGNGDNGNTAVTADLPR